MPAPRVHLFGQSGRLGGAAARLQVGAVEWTDAGSADVWMLAVPTAAAGALLAAAGSRTVLDLSGALKRQVGGRYAFFAGDGSAVGGASTAHKQQRGGLRLSRRLSNHPHADEVHRATGATVASFALTVAYPQPGSRALALHQVSLAVGSPRSAARASACALQPPNNTIQGASGT